MDQASVFYFSQIGLIVLISTVRTFIAFISVINVALKVDRRQLMLFVSNMNRGGVACFVKSNLPNKFFIIADRGNIN